MTDALIVFAKPPTPGRVKTRLVPPLTPAEAAALYRAFLEDTLEQYASVDADVRLYVASASDDGGERSEALDPTHFVQSGRGLGERMLHAFAETFAAGYERAAIVGTDHPTLPTAFVEKAFEILGTPRSVVLGPAEDGGYYLIGANDLRPELFRGMSYSHAQVLEETIARASGVSLAILPLWYDVDSPEDLARLAAELEGDETRVPRTRKVVARIAGSLDGHGGTRS